MVFTDIWGCRKAAFTATGVEKNIVKMAVFGDRLQQGNDKQYFQNDWSSNIRPK